VRFLDIVAFAWRSLRRRRGRTVLTGLAVTLGSALLVGLLAVSTTAESRVVSQLGKGGPVAAIHVDDSLPSPDALTTDELATAGHHDLDAAALGAIRRASHVAAVVPVLTVPVLALPCPPAQDAAERSPSAACLRKPAEYRSALVGTDLRQAGALPISVLGGRLPDPASPNEVAVTAAYLGRIQLPAAAASQVLGTRVALGTARILPTPDRVQVRWIQATVVGVVAQSVESGEFLAPLQQTVAARAFSLSGSTPADVFPGIQSSYSAAVVVADSLDHVHAVRGELFALGYASSAPEHLVSSVERYLHVVDIVLGGIGLIALGIAALGIATSMLSAVRERWYDIGVLKAIGARDRDVLLWFLVEAAIMGGAGGVAGTVLGLALAWALGLSVNTYLVQQGLAGVDLSSIPFGLAIVAPGAACAVAMLAAAMPSLWAARLPARAAIGRA
jgi:putative ABC transport system permease protein